MKLLLILAVVAALLLLVRSGLRYLAGIYTKADTADAINTAWYN